MPTKNPRLNITVEPDMADILSSLATEEKKSVSNIINELILEALDRREDMALSAIADSRTKKKFKRIKHEDAWK